MGRPIKADLAVDSPMNKDNKYFSNQWRRDGVGNPGGFLVESTVHFIAGLRMVLAGAAAAPGGEGSAQAAAATGLIRHADKSLPPPDTLVGTLVFPGAAGAPGDNGVPVAVSVTFAAAARRFHLSVVCPRGTVEARPPFFLS